MSKIGKISLVFSFLSFIALMVTRLVLGGWVDGMWAPLALFLVFFAAAVIVDRRFYLELLSMRTTKHGMNMGALILIAIVILGAVNYLAVRYEKKFDVTSEKLNSLSDQSVKAAQGLKQDVELVLLYHKSLQDQENAERSVRKLADMYRDASPKISFSAFDAIKRPDLAQKYEFRSGAYALYLVAGEQRIRVDKPTEEDVTNALLKLGREKKKVVYFTAGHGERSLDQPAPESASEFKKDLEPVYDVKTLQLVEQGKVPDDAAVVAIVGPRQQFLEAELKALRDYARAGGRLFIAIDPGEKHNLAQLTKSFGVEFANNYVLDPRAAIQGAGNVLAVGSVFSPESEITKSFATPNMAIFMLGSALSKAPDAPASLVIDEIVKTTDRSISIASLEANARPDKQDSFTIGMTVKGKVAEDAKDFAAVIFGDSDFVSSALYRQNLNRDLAMNAISSLSQDSDLISIRPKQPKGTTLTLTGQQFLMLVLGFMLPLPLLLFIGGGVIWWRRKAA